MAQEGNNKWALKMLYQSVRLVAERQVLAFGPKCDGYVNHGDEKSIDIVDKLNCRIITYITLLLSSSGIHSGSQSQDKFSDLVRSCV